jgi:hypothetical protein
MPVLEWGNVPNRPDAETFSLAPESNESQVETRTAVIPVALTEPESKPAAEPPAAVEAPKRSTLVPRDPGDQFALAAAGITGFGLVLSVVPYGHIGTVLCATVGVIVGLLGLLAADRSRRWTAVSAGVAAVVLSVVCLAPDWLGLRPWGDDSPSAAIPVGQIRSVARDGSGAAAPAGEWVDASRAAWRQDDVEVSATAFIGPVELVGPKGQKKWTKERYLVITVRIGNKGAERKISVSAWPTVDGSAPQATADGTPLTVPTFDSGWTAASTASGAAVFPGKSHTQVLIYSVPPKGDVSLTIPAAGIGSRDPAKLLIPRPAASPSGRPGR